MHATERVPNDRRSGVERRHYSIAAYWRGALNPRRRMGRRTTDRVYTIIDWHSPRVLALVLLILGLSTLDGVLTLMLMSQGAQEVNPVMALFVPHNLGWFAAIKLTLTSVGAAILVVCARMKLFRLFPGEVLLYLVVGCYVALVAYELELLANPPPTF
ncbi:hypothetical protein GCM10011487_02460 [Steroidobacter agaridevorans]|uniref:DUF5658 domain-containing protein n=1 Tax=Steroidobacter agaridevorans TaxID=2695856 RepID=A0A829Y606_9GAMM|nr:DUF5658 family protein [Steroidobacter agaridevorans]GFE78246.1 hypothetical protein GCM10011487_02460 [Steroidobacter agaridevorans]GFE91303.1 hypothetical protein GCM10011488_62570 [Steroidobacter agaridevorans]